MLKRILSLVLALIITVCAIFTTGAASINDLKSQQEQLEREAQKYQQIIDEKQDEIDKQQEYVDAVADKVANLNGQISVSREKIAYYEGEVTRLEGEAQANMELLRKRIRALYMAGDTSALDIILGAKDFSDFVDKLQLVESINDYDAKLIDDIEGQLDTVNTELTALSEEKAVLDGKLSDLNVLLAEHEQVLKTLYAEQNEVEDLMHSNELEQSEVNDQIEAYYEEQKKQQQQQQQQQQGSSGGSNTVTPGSSGGYVWPVPGFYYLTSKFYEDRTNYYHGGIDIAGAGYMGTTVIAAASGTVISANNSCVHNWGKYGSCGCGGGYGNYVWIDHGNGKATIYAHLSSISVYSGSYVSAGQIVGYGGSTGSSTGPHLHFECRYYGTKYDPMSEY